MGNDENLHPPFHVEKHVKLVAVMTHKRERRVTGCPVRKWMPPGHLEAMPRLQFLSRLAEPLQNGIATGMRCEKCPILSGKNDIRTVEREVAETTEPSSDNEQNQNL